MPSRNAGSELSIHKYCVPSIGRFLVACSKLNNFRYTIAHQQLKVWMGGFRGLSKTLDGSCAGLLLFAGLDSIIVIAEKFFTATKYKKK